MAEQKEIPEEMKSLMKVGDNVTPEIKTVKVPKPGKKEVLVKVHAASLNPVDWKVVLGAFGAMKELGPIGSDLSGVVVALGEDVDEFKVGDEVCGVVTPMPTQGSFAEYAITSVASIVKKLPAVSHIDASCLGIVYATVWEGLTQDLKITKDDIVYVPGGAGGVGHVAIKFAKAAGATVVSSASRDESTQFIKEKLGVDKVFNYKNQTADEGVKALTGGKLATIILDATYEEKKQLQSVPAIAEDGTWIAVYHTELPADGAVRAAIKAKNAKYADTDMGRKWFPGIEWEKRKKYFHSCYSDVLEKIAAGQLEGPSVTHIVDGLDNAAQAILDFKAGKYSKGKTVLKIL